MAAAKFVFMSASTNSMGGDDGCTRTGFEEFVAREPSSRDGGVGRGGGGWSTSRPPFSASGANMGTGDRKNAGALSGIAGGQKRKGAGDGAVEGGGVGMGRLWKGLCAGSKVNESKRSVS